LTVFTEDQLYASALSYFRLSFPNQDLSDRSFFGLLARAFARFFSLAQQQVLQVSNDSVPAYQQDADGNLRSKCSREQLETWAFVFGVQSDVPGIFGPRGAKVSTGGLAVPTVSTGAVVVPAGTLAKDLNGLVTVKTVAAVTLNGPPNTTPVQLVSVTKGTAANLSAGTQLQWTSPPAGLDSTFSLSSGLRGGLDVESDVSLISRILRRVQNPNQFREWAEESTDANGEPLNIARAYVYQHRSGLGTVDIVVVYAGSGLGRKPPATEIAKVQAYVDKRRFVTSTVYVRPPAMSASNALRARVRVTPSVAKANSYAWDFDDGGVARTITSHTANSVTVAALPVSLINAFFAGSKPRIQIPISTAGSGPLPYVGRVTGIVGTTLTLDPPFLIQPTDGTDYFYAGSAFVLPVASQILAVVDALGPSRQSGYADPNDSWESEVRLERIVDAVMETRDTDGTRMVAGMPGFPATAVQLAVGTGAFGALPYLPLDVGSGIEIAFLRDGGIEVIQ
jgi:hypothetical protein